MALVSIIIPTYNSSKFIYRTVESVLNQTYDNFELIIIDDASSDNTVSIIKEFIKKDKRIRLIERDKNSGGPAKPTNEGLKKAKGDFIAFLDADDHWLPDKLKKQMEVLRSANENVGAVVCMALLVFSDRYSAPQFSYPLDGNVLKATLCAQFFFNFSILLMKKEVLDKVGFLDENFRLAADQDYFIRISRNTSFIFLSQELVKYSMHSGNISRDPKLAQCSASDLEMLISKHHDIFLQNPDCYHRRLVHLGRTLISAGEFRKARDILKKSINIYPLSLTSWFYFFLSFSGTKLYKSIKFFKNKLLWMF